MKSIIRKARAEDIKKSNRAKRSFAVGVGSKKNINKVFEKHTDDLFEFNKTKVLVSLYRMDTVFMCRSRARRILSGLEKFKTITIDFKGVDMVGQSFADEVFRVWKNRHPNIIIQFQNANRNVVFMIKRALSRQND